MKISTRQEFDVYLGDALHALDQLNQKYPGDELLESIQNQLRAIKQWTLGGKNLTQEQKDRLNLGLRAQREMSGDDPMATDLVVSIHGYILRDMPTAKD
jgi:hypothetical protein